MKRKIQILIERDVIELAKRRAGQEGRPIGELIQAAIIAYLNKKEPDLFEQEKAYKSFCERPIRINRKQFGSVVKEDAWSQ